MIYLLVPNPPKQKSTTTSQNTRVLFFSLRDIEKCRVCAGLVRNEHVLSLENVPSVEKRKRVDIGILVREAEGRWLLLSMGAASVHGIKDSLH